MADKACLGYSKVKREQTGEETVRASPLESAIAKQEKLRSRLDAEASVGVSAALVGSFALSLLVEAKDMEDGSSVQWMFVLFMATSGSLCLVAVITTGTIYWAGTHIMSATLDNVAQENDLFRAFWKLGAMRAARTGARRAFQLSVPLFLAGITVMIQSFTGDESGGVSVVAAVVGGVFSATITFGLIVTALIERYTSKTTATA